eukprot:gene7454-8878_t
MNNLADEEFLVACTLCEQEKDSLISTLMRYMLFKQTATAGLVKREELTKIVGEKYAKGNRNLPTHIILHAQIKFPKLFGMELREIEKAKKYVQPGQKKPPEGERTFYQLAENAVDEFPKQVLESYMSSVMVGEDDEADDDDGVDGTEN